MNKRSNNALMTLYNGLFEMLLDTPFDKITVRGVCAYTRVNKMTFYKYHTDKFDVLSKACKAKFNEDFLARFGSAEALFNERGFEPAVYECIRFLFAWCKQYRIQLRNLFTAANQIAYDIAKAIIFKDYFEYLNSAVDFERFGVTPTYMSSFLFGGLVATMEQYLRDVRLRPDQDEVEMENEGFCRYMARIMTVSYAKPEAVEAVLAK